MIPTYKQAMASFDKESDWPHPAIKSTNSSHVEPHAGSDSKRSAKASGIWWWSTTHF